MKIFYKKDFQRVLKEKYKLKEEYEEYKTSSKKMIKELNNKGYELLCENLKFKDLKLDVDEVKKQLRIVNGAKGGLIRENHKLKNIITDKDNEIADLKAKISDLKSDRYLIKKIPSGRTKSTLKTTISNPMKPAVRKFMKENFDK